MKDNHLSEALLKAIEPETQALIFDLDGTLVDSNPAHYAAWKDACNKFGMQYPKHRFFEFAGLPSTKIADEIIALYPEKKDFPAKKLADAKEKAFDRYQEQIRPNAPVVSLLKEFYKKLPMALGTGRIRSSTMRTLEVLSLKNYFDVIVTADDVSRFKPDPETFLKCAVSMNIDPNFCIVFEDAERGLTAAIQAGMKVVNVRKFLGPEKL